MSQLPFQLQPFYLAGSGVGIGATSITLRSMVDIDGNAITDMSGFGTIGFGTLEPDNQSKEEQIQWTGITANANGTVTLTGVSNVAFKTPYTVTSGVKKSHPGGVKLVVSNTSAFYQNFVGLGNNNTFTGINIFPTANYPKMDIAGVYPTLPEQLAPKGYVDATMTGLVGTATQTNAGTTRLTKNQGTKPRATSTLVREQDSPNMTLKVEQFTHTENEKIVTYAGGNSPAIINPGLAGDLMIQTNPANGETVTLTINGTVCTFTWVTSIGSTAGNVLIQGTAAASRAAIAALINAPSTTNANQVAFTGAQLAAMGYVSGTDDLATTIFVKAINSTVTTLTGAETMAGANNTWTANTTKNRYDLVVAQSSDSTIQIRRGTEAVSPAMPTPTSGDIVLSQVYCRIGMTSIKDVDDATNGYIYAWPVPQIYRTDLVLASNIKFGGTGADGALVITSGTTNIDLTGLAVFVKNYSSISITGTGQLKFINPHANGTIIIIKSQGNVTITSSTTPCIDASGCGAAGGAGGAAGSAGGNGNNASGILDVSAHYGSQGTYASGASAAGGLVYANTYLYIRDEFNVAANRKYKIQPGSGGGGGSGERLVTGGAGGRGGAGLLIECGGAFNFTTANGISVNGADGVAGTLGSTNAQSIGGGGGGGAGAGGSCVVLYNSLTAKTGTITDNGGTGGSGGGVNHTSGGSGGEDGQSGAGGGGAGQYGGAGGVGGIRVTSGSGAGAAGGAATGLGAGGGGGSGASVAYNSATVYSGGSGGAPGGSFGGIMIQNYYF